MALRSPLLYLLHLGLLLLAWPASAAFKCTAPSKNTCQALAGFAPANATTLGAVKSLFNIRNLRTLVAANGLPLSTPSSFPISTPTSFPISAPIRVPIPCSCGRNSTGASAGVPTYTVRPGDTLDDIATGTFAGLLSYHDIADANNISDPNVIKVGQRLWIPIPCSCDRVDGADVTHLAYVVPAGSTVSGIAAQYGLTAETIMRINGISSPASLLASQVLDLPLRACSSSISNESLDYNLRAANGSYVLTSNNCVICSCSSSTWQLDCHPTQGISPSVCPTAMCGNLYIGNTTTTGCEFESCAYAGYIKHSKTRFTILTNLTTHSFCNNGSSIAPAPHQGNAWRLGSQGLSQIEILILLHVALIALGFL